MSKQFILNLFLIAGLLVGLSFMGTDSLRSVDAQEQSPGLSGYAWSHNIGWISMSCENTNTCSVSDYKVAFTESEEEGVLGDLSGYAWSSHIGWVNFSIGGPYPETPDRSAYINDSNQILGWARACSVFTSGCSGSLKPQNLRGGWDGWIKLGGGWSNSPVLSESGAVSGYAWGDDVVGWVSLAGVTCNNCGGGGTGGDDYSLAVTISGEGGVVGGSNSDINCSENASGVESGVCDEEYTSQTEVVLTATPEGDNDTTSWGGACLGNEGNTCTVNVNGVKSVTVTFSNDGGPGGDEEYKLEVIIEGGGSGSVTGEGINCNNIGGSSDCDETYDNSEEITLTATAEDGDKFAGWEGACSGTGDTCIVNVNDPNNITTVTATFNDDGEVEEFNFTLNCSDDSGSKGCFTSINCDALGFCDEQNAYSNQIITVQPENVNGSNVTFDLLKGSLPDGFGLVVCENTDKSSCNPSVDVTYSINSNNPFYLRAMRESDANSLGNNTKIMRIQSGSIYHDLQFAFIPEPGTGQ